MVYFIVTGAWKEPVPGWTISKNGPQGFLMGASKGVIRRLPIDTNVVTDYIPVDIVVNQILVTGYYVSNKKSNEVSIFHCTSSTTKPFKWEIIQDKLNGCLHKYPLKSAVWLVSALISQLNSNKRHQLTVCVFLFRESGIQN